MLLEITLILNLKAAAVIQAFEEWGKRVIYRHSRLKETVAKEEGPDSAVSKEKDTYVCAEGGCSPSAVGTFLLRKERRRSWFCFCSQFEDPFPC